jgi:glycosyltransferase involved in cell wall biosynthesis
MSGVRVLRFAHASGKLPISYLYGGGDPVASASFEAIIEHECPDIVHLHAFTPAVSIRLVRLLKHREIPVVFTYHTPTVSCQRGTLMEWGRAVCDGHVDTYRCAACSLHARGVPRLAAVLAARVPPAVTTALERLGFEGDFSTALRIPALIQNRHAAFRELLESADHIVAPSVWVRDVLVRNGVELKKVTVSRQGISTSGSTRDRLINQGKENQCGRKIRFACLVRFDPSKGVHVIVDALRLLPDVDFQIDVFGIVQSDHDNAYLRLLRSKASGDRRIQFRTSFSREEILQQLVRYDAMIVPSVWLETGPLVVLEAFAAGIPVIGSRLGGITERIVDGKDGILIQPADTRAWADVIRRLVEKPDVLAKLRAGVIAPRTMDDVATDMTRIYSALVNS